MSRFRRPRGLTIWLLLLPLLWEVACSRPDGLRPDEGAGTAAQHQVPFHDGDGSAPGNPSASSAGQDKGIQPETDLPFRDPQSLPAGTLLTVRLKSSVSADDPAASGTFEAVVDEPVAIEGNTVVPRGASVAGRVESARASKVKRSGYVRLTLDSLDIAGNDLHLQTSSLLARGNAPGSDAALEVITLEKGRRLTFRLTEPVYVASTGH
jgi:hypothetical protein